MLMILILLVLLAAAIAVLLFCVAGLLPAAHATLSVLCVIAGILLSIPLAVTIILFLVSRLNAGKNTT